MKEYKKYLFAALMVLGVSVNAGGTNIATWGQESISANTAVTASGGDANNSGRAKFNSTKAMTSKGGSGSKAYYAAAAGGSVITFYDLNLSTYTGIQISFYSKASQSGTMTLAFSVDSVSWIDINSVALSTTEGQKTITGIPYYAKYLRLTHSYKGGSLYFGTVVISGTSASSTMKAVSWSVDGEAYSTGSPTTSVPNGEKVGKLPTEPSGCSASQVFVGWSASAIDGSTNTEPSDLFRTASEAPTVSTPTTYYAVFAEASSGDPTNRVYSFASTSDASTSISAGWSMSLAPGNGYGDTYGAQWDRNGYASLPTFKFTPTARISKISIKVRQNNTTGSTSVSCNVGGTTISTSAVDGTSQYDMEFSPSASSKGQIIISCVNTSTANSGCGNFNVKSITLTEDGTTYSNYVTTCCEKHDAIFGHDGSGNDPDDQSACENISVSFTPDPAEGYEYGGATIYEDDVETQITTLSSSTTSFDMYDRDVYVLVHYVPGNYTITLNNQGATTAGTEEISVTYGSAENLDASPAITVPTKTGYTFGGYWTATGGGGVQVIDASGDVIADVDDGVDFYTSEDKEYFYPGDLTLYAKWTINKYKLSIASVDNVVICATTPSLAEGDDPVDVNYGSTVTLSHGDPTGGKTWSGWNAYKTGDTGTPVVVDGNNQFVMPAYDVTVSANLYSDFVFSCAELTLTKSGVDTMFITSTANKSVRSQEAFHLTGSGLTPNTKFTFSFGNSDLNSRFAFKLADGTTDVSTDASGAIDADIYVVYTPTSGDTDDGLNIATNLTVTMDGTKPKTAVLNTKTIIGRHLPADFVIAAKRNNQWYALPSNMSSTSNPSMVEIAVDDADNPSIAYTATSNMYSLYDQSAGEYIKFAMKGQSNAPLFGSASSAPIGKSGDAIVTSTLGDGYLWKLVQSRATGLSNAEEAKYTIYSKNNSSNHLRLKENAGNPIWGLYNSGIEELRLIPAQEKNVVEAYFIEYGATGGIIEVDANGISAKKVKAKFNGNTSNLIALSQTLTSVNGSATKYNYTVTFDNDVNFAASDAVGKILMLEWYNSSDVLVGVTSIEMPKIIASSSTMSSINGTKGYWKDLEVHVLPGATLTVNTGSFSNAVTIDHLEIYPGATVSVAPAGAAGTLTVGTLVLRNGWRRVGAKRYDVARLYLQPTIDASHQAASLVHENAYSDWYIDFDQYYSIAVPFPVTISEMRYKNSNTAVTVSPTGTVRMRYYDGQNCVDKNKDNWKYYGTDTTKAVPNQLVPDSAYAITAKRPTGKAFSIIRMPMTFNDAWTTGGELGTATISATTYRKDTIRVTAYKKGEGTTPEQSKGWNYIANPFMSLYSGYLSYGVDDNIEYVNIPDSCFKEFTQLPMNGTSKLRPATGVLIQAPKTGRITFGATDRAASAPSYRNEEQPDYTPIQRAYIQLGNESTNDLMGLLISSRYSAEYEINADLQKLLGDGNVLRTYMLYNDIEMAYLAINEQLAQEWIPITIRIPTDGEYTFSMHEASVVGNLEGVYLIDYSNEQVTNLIEEDYTFNTTSGTISGRFAINAIAGQHETPTDIDIIQGGGDLHSDQPFKFLYHDKVFIYHRGVIYDATGKKIKVINK